MFIIPDDIKLKETSPGLWEARDLKALAFLASALKWTSNSSDDNCWSQYCDKYNTGDDRYYPLRIELRSSGGYSSSSYVIHRVKDNQKRKTIKVTNTCLIPASGKGKCVIRNERNLNIAEVIFVPLIGRAYPCVITWSEVRSSQILINLMDYPSVGALPVHIGTIVLNPETGEYVTTTRKCPIGARLEINYTHDVEKHPGLIEFIPHIWRVEHKDALIQLAANRRWKITKATDVADLAKEADYPLAVYDLATIYGQDFPTQFKIISAKDVKLPNWK